MTIIDGSAMYPERKRLFPIRRLDDGTPCIEGTAPSAHTDGFALNVYAPTGGHTRVHPSNTPGKVLYEIHSGDFVGVLEKDWTGEFLFLYSYYIRFIGPDNLAHGITARLD